MKDLLGLSRRSSSETGNKRYKQFVQEHLVTKQKSIFSKITKEKLNTGLEKPRKPVKQAELLKDVQGLLAEQAVSLEEAFKYPITTLPLSIAESTSDLRGATNSTKSQFRNELIETTNCISYICPENSVWIYDARKTIREVSRRETYQSFFDAILKKMTVYTRALDTSRAWYVNVKVNVNVNGEYTKKCSFVSSIVSCFDGV